ncbi:MAG: hypothetical protein ACOYXA_07340 [Bacteroidota bacterium]
MKKVMLAILTTGLLIGLMDGIAASVNAYFSSGATPDRVFRFIASGVFGTDAFKDSHVMVVWGVAFHFLIALLWTALYFWLATQFEWPRQHYVVSGILYGLFIWAAMTYLVLPLSNTPASKPSLPGALIMIGIHTLVIGIPMAYRVSRHFMALSTTH